MAVTRAAGASGFQIRRADLRAGVLACLVLAGLVVAGPASSAPAPFWPDTRYDPDVPTLEAVVGHDFGTDLTAPADIVRYVEALTAAVPERTRLVQYARSWEGRPLHYLVVGSAANVARLDEIRAGMQRLADPRGATADELDALVERLPVVVWLAHGVHGDEVSSSDAALLTAYHLLASREDDVAGWLENAVVVIDPSQNPDGRARFVHHYRSVRGPVPQPSPIAAERAQTWPGGRTNHYLFDMNRDWFALTQPEVRGRVRAFLEYYPLVHVDLHEMGTDASYYFPPPAVPYNPYLSDAQHDVLSVLGRGNAAAFDRFGFSYYTREIFDAYYPGYGDTWPALHGAAGMTFEMASARGLLGQRSDGSLVSYRDGVRRHFVASLATIGTAAGERGRLLEQFLTLRSTPIDDMVYVLSRQPDPGRTDELARLLQYQGVEVRRVPDDTRLCGGQVAAGSYLVSAAQPAGRLAGTLLAAESPAAAEFWQEQERRAAKRLPVEVYDVVGWSLPLLFDVPMVSCRAAAGRYPVVDAERAAPVPPPGDAAVAYLVPWGTRAAVRLLAAALGSGLQVDMASASFTRGGEVFPRGSLIVRRSANDSDLPRLMAAIVSDSGARVVAADSSWMDAGIDLGSDRVRPVPAPRVAVAWDEPTATYSAGAWRYVLERKLGYPVTPVRVVDLSSRWLDQFDVLVLPEGGDYADALGEEGSANIERWVRRGGTLIGVGGALAYLAGAELLSSRPELRVVADAAASTAAAEPFDKEPGMEPDGEGGGDADGDDGEEDGPSSPVPGTIIADDDDYRAAIRPEEEPPREIPGVLVRAKLDADHWLAAGLPAEVPFMLTGGHIFTPLPRDKGTNVASFAASGELKAGGHLWPGADRQLARKPVVMVQAHERGQVVAFVADPSFRGMMNGLDVLVANAVFFGPAAARPVPAPPPVRR